MILVDYSHLQMRNLYIAIANARPKKKDGVLVTDEFIKMFYHQMLASMRLISRTFKDYGEVVICVDARSYWRKDIYPQYKGHRKKDREESDINFDEFYSYATEFLNVLRTEFPYTVVEVEKAEADDIIGILSEIYGQTEKVICVTSDKDMKQIIKHGAELYDPITKKHVRMTKEELDEWMMIHILVGDDGDNIPNIKRGTQFTDNFLKFLKDEEIHLKDQKLADGYVETIVEQFNQLSIGDHLFAKYDVWKETKKDGKFKDIFKATPFGEVGAKKFLGNGKQDLIKNLNANKLYLEHFRRNKELVLFSSIPEWLFEDVREKYKSVERVYSSNGMMSFLMKNSLNEHMMNITDFELSSRRMQPQPDMLDEWA